MSTPESVGDRLRARRLELGFTLAEVANRAGLSLPYVSNLERGRGNPTIDALTSLAHALDLALGDLLGESVDAEIDFGLAHAPKSLQAFARTQRFAAAVDRLSRLQRSSPDAMRKQLLIAMTSAPRRSAGEPTEDDWRRLLDVYALILQDPDGGA